LSLKSPETPVFNANKREIIEEGGQISLP